MTLKNERKRITCESFIDDYYKCLKTCKENPIGAATELNEKCSRYFKAYQTCNYLCKRDLENCKIYLDAFTGSKS